MNKSESGLDWPIFMNTLECSSSTCQPSARMLSCQKARRRFFHFAFHGRIETHWFMQIISKQRPSQCHQDLLLCCCCWSSWSFTRGRSPPTNERWSKNTKLQFGWKANHALFPTTDLPAIVAQWLQHRLTDWEVAGLNPSGCWGCDFFPCFYS